MNLEKELEQIKERNTRVEADKAWETSLFRVVLISSVTYLVTSFIFYTLGVREFWQSAVIPATGYFLSTQSIPFVKKWWIKNRYK